MSFLSSGGQEEHGALDYNLLEKQSKEADHIRRSLSVLFLNILYSPPVLFFSANVPTTGQSSQLLFDAHHGDAQFLPNLADASLEHKARSFKGVLKRLTILTFFANLRRIARTIGLSDFPAQHLPLMVQLPQITKMGIGCVLLAGCFLASHGLKTGLSQTSHTAQTSAAVPEESRQLYKELDETLRADRSLYALEKGVPCPLFAPALFMAGSGFGPAASDSQRWKDLLDTLDAFKAAGMSGVSVMIAAPDLSLGDPKPLIAFYQRLAASIHSRGMKLYIEHFDNPPFSPHAHKVVPDSPQARKDFLAMREKEATLIYREIKPDYLSLITEPETMIRWSHLAFTADELASWIGEVTSHLKNDGSSPNTLLGAGTGTWEPEDLLRKIAQAPKLDYVDMHFLALKLNDDDMVAKFAERVRKIRQARPNMGITMGETWLYKHGARESKGMLNRDAFFRDNFSFWSPLDEQFLALVMAMAQKENISVVAPYFSQYFFSYYTFGDSESLKLPPWPSSIPVSWNKALESIHDHQSSATGKAVSAILRDCGR